MSAEIIKFPARAKPRPAVHAVTIGGVTYIGKDAGWFEREMREALHRAFGDRPSDQEPV